MGLEKATQHPSVVTLDVIHKERPSDSNSSVEDHKKGKTGHWSKKRSKKLSKFNLAPARSTTNRSFKKSMSTSRNTKSITDVGKPGSKKLSHEVVICDALHDGKLILQQNLRIKTDTLFDWLFSSSSKFLINFHASRNSTNLQLNEWRTNSDGLRVRVVQMTVALQANVGPKTARVTENQTIRSCSKAGHLYAVDVLTSNEDIPYADAFNISLHYCLLQKNDDTTDLVVYATVNFLKSIWAVIKAFIVKNSYEGLIEFFKELYNQLQKEIAKPP